MGTPRKIRWEPNGISFSEKRNIVIWKDSGTDKAFGLLRKLGLRCKRTENIQDAFDSLDRRIGNFFDELGPPLNDFPPHRRS